MLLWLFLPTLICAGFTRLHYIRPWINRWKASAAKTRIAQKIFKCELSFEKLQTYIFDQHIDCVILYVQCHLCFTKVCEMGGIFDKNSFILGTKLNVLKNVLLRVEREVQFRWEHSFFFVASMLRASQRRVRFSGSAEFAKSVQPRVRFKKSSQQTCNGCLCLLQYFVSVKFFVLLRVCNCKIKMLLYEKVKVYTR